MLSSADGKPPLVTARRRLLRHETVCEAFDIKDERFVMLEDPSRRIYVTDQPHQKLLTH